MPDRLYLSLWIRGFDEGNMLRHFGRMLGAFPFSRLRPGIAALRIYAIEEVEPPLLEQAFAGDADVETVLRIAGEFENPDCAYMVEGWWELWRFQAEWKLAPSPVTLFCFGPQFENDAGDHLRIELGVDSQFLPQPSLPQGARRAQSNLQSVVRLARELESSMPLESRRIWCESGENFADRVGTVLSGWE